jgi:hypothetical protein
MENNNPQEKSFLNLAFKGVALVIGLFMLGHIIGSLTNVQHINNLQTVDNQTTVSETTTAPTLPSTTLPTTAPTTETTTETPTTTTKPTTTVPTTIDTTPDTKKEIVAIFNKSANKVKKKAVKVIRNYENLRKDKDMCDYPPAWDFAGGVLVNTWLVNHDTPLEYTGKDLIKENFPVKGKDWSSKLTDEDVDLAKLTEKDGKYHIELSLAYCKNPEENTGVCTVMEEVNLAKVRQLVDYITKCETEYYDCKIECIVEKDTGNLIYIKYTQPMIFNLTTELIRVLHGVFAMTIESEYEIYY